MRQDDPDPAGPRPVRDDIEPGRAAFARRQWRTACDLLAGAVEVDELELLAAAAYLAGREAEGFEVWERAHRACIDRGDLERAALHAAWLAFAFLLRGDTAHSGGWLARAERLVEEVGNDCSARGWALVPPFLEALYSGDGHTAKALADDTLDLARRLADTDLLAMGLLISGEAELALGRVSTAMRRFDEAMVSITAGEVSAITTGIVYCAVIERCISAFDLPRAAEWTEALSAWCAAQSELVPYRGQCLVHRSQVLLASGAWDDAVSEAERAELLLSEPLHPALGLAMYQRGELHRLRGEFPAAEQAYRVASQHGREPVPGLALLRLAEGNLPAAVASARTMLETSRGSVDRPTMLAGAVEILLAADDRKGAAAAGDELTVIAGRSDVPLLSALATSARGAVLVAHGEARAALVPLREAEAGWRALGVPYEEARVRVVHAVALSALGDLDGAELELEAAAAAFARLGARPDLARVQRLRGLDQVATRQLLSEREREVLRLVAAGRTNRDIAVALVISEHTVARHLQNIFSKLGVSSRAAATAYAYEHHLIAAAP